MSPLSYPTLKRVFEHIEANWRLHICSLCPSLRKIDTTIPLRLNGLCFHHYGVNLNDMIYQIMTGTEETYDKNPEDSNSPADIQLGDRERKLWTRRYLIIKIRHDRNRKSTERRIPVNGDIHVGYRKILELLLTGRSEIRIGRLDFFYQKQDILPLPIGLPKFKVNFLNSGPFDFTKFLPLFHPSSFPLKELQIPVKSDENLTHPVLRTARKLSIRNISNNFVNWIDEVKKLPNKSIWLGSLEISEQNIFAIVEYWRHSNRDIGSKIMIYREHVIDVSGLLETSQRRFNGKTVKFKEEIERTWCPISIPMSSTSELVIYGLMQTIPDSTITISALVVKVMPVGSTVPISVPAAAAEGLDFEVPLPAVENKIRQDEKNTGFQMNPIKYGTPFLMVVVCVILAVVLSYFVNY